MSHRYNCIAVSCKGTIIYSMSHRYNMSHKHNYKAVSHTHKIAYNCEDIYDIGEKLYGKVQISKLASPRLAEKVALGNKVCHS